MTVSQLVTRPTGGHVHVDPYRQTEGKGASGAEAARLCQSVVVLRHEYAPVTSVYCRCKFPYVAICTRDFSMIRARRMIEIHTAEKTDKATKLLFSAFTAVRFFH